jgi:hypothetical protein
MSLDEFLEYIEMLSTVAASSDDENVRKLGGVLISMRAVVLSGDQFLESYFDQMLIINKNMKSTLLAQMDR